MAQRRMFSLHVIDTDSFLDMPVSSQNLYFHLGMRADDDGFVSNPKKIMKITGSQEDDLKILFSKRFILGFESGIIVIKHWRIHNYIAKDRYNETVYLEEKNKITIKENGSYTDCIHNVSTLETQVSIGKISKDKVSKVNKKMINKKANLDIKEEKNKYSEYVYMFEKEYNSLIDKYGKHNTQKMIEKLDAFKGSKGKTYKDDYRAILNWVVEACKVKTLDDINEYENHMQIKKEERKKAYSESADPQTIQQILSNSKFAKKL